MKIILVIILITAYSAVVSAATSSVITKSQYPQGTFKKLHNGNFVQIDEKGKKIGTYKITNGKLTKIK